MYVLHLFYVCIYVCMRATVDVEVREQLVKIVFWGT